LQILADENIYGRIVAWLRDGGHDVVYAAESMSGSADAEIAARCEADHLVLLTEDKGFGDLAVRGGFKPAGIILLRLDNEDSEQRLARLVRLWPFIEGNVAGHLVTVSRQHLRVRSI
jgi:predicted nuclease of predicted toxin-antitoxin system